MHEQLQDELHELHDKKLEKLYEIIGYNSYTDMVMWDWFEENLSDAGIYPGDAIPEEFLEIMNEGQVDSLYNVLLEKFPDIKELRI